MQDIRSAIELGVALIKDIMNVENNFLETAIRKYVGELIKRNCTIKVLGMRKPLPLEKLYVRANILKDKITAELGLSAKELEKFYNVERRAFGKIAETVDGELMANKLQHFIVLGKPGAGKTTYLRYLTLMMLNPYSQIKERKIPIFVTFREWSDKKMPLLDFIVEQFKICGFEEAKFFVEEMLERGNCLVLFDGLDEVSHEVKQASIINQVKDFSYKYNNNQLIISCRVAAYNRWFNQFTDVEIADFNDNQISQFIQNWFHENQKTSEECWQKLQKSPQLKELASVPLLLTLLCIAYDRSNSFLPNRSNIYEEAINVLLREWDETKPLERDVIYKQLSLKRKEAMFARIAWGVLTENIYFIPEQVLIKQIEKFLESLTGLNTEENAPDGKAILESIEAQHGIFIERAKQVHSFAHLSFQEYFTAKYIEDNTQNGALEKLVDEHLYDDRWKEVFLMVTELVDSADVILLLMLFKNRELLKNKLLNEFLFLTKECIIFENSNWQLIDRHIMAIGSHLYLTQDRFSTGGRFKKFEDTLSNSSSIATNLALSLNSSISEALKKADKFAWDFDSIYGADIATDYTISISESFGFKMNEEIIMNFKLWDTESYEALLLFLKANALIAQCKKNANNISEYIDEKILKKMLASMDEG